MDLLGELLGHVLLGDLGGERVRRGGWEERLRRRSKRRKGDKRGKGEKRGGDLLGPLEDDLLLQDVLLEQLLENVRDLGRGEERVARGREKGRKGCGKG